MLYKIAIQYARRRKKEYRKKYRMTLAGWILFHNRNIVLSKCHWMGVKAQKNPLDAWIYQELIYETRPEVIVEIGSAEGGGALFLAGMLDLLGGGMVVSVDIDHSRFAARHERIVTVTGDSLSPDTLERVRDLCDGKRVMVIHDGDHSRDHVLADLNAYSPLIGEGCYFVVEDGVVDLFRPRPRTFGIFPDGGPLPAIEEFMRGNEEFTVDRERERYVLSYNPKGYLRRIK